MKRIVAQGYTPTRKGSVGSRGFPDFLLLVSKLVVCIRPTPEKEEFDSLTSNQFLSVARDVPLGLINLEHLISALRGFEYLTDNQFG
jgi:hypothetical protein